MSSKPPRLLSLLAASAAAVSVAVAPALASEEDRGVGGRHVAEQVTPSLPQPVAPPALLAPLAAPAPVAFGPSTSPVAGSDVKPERVHLRGRAFGSRTVADRVLLAPRGGVAAGAGGMAPAG
jgi:hypothetical protein